MKEDLAIAKNSLLSLYEENRLLKCELGKEEGSDKLSDGVRISNYSDGDSENGKSAAAEIAELKQRLDEERRLRQESDKELQLQVMFFYFYLKLKQVKTIQGEAPLQLVCIRKVLNLVLIEYAGRLV